MAKKIDGGKIFFGVDQKAFRAGIKGMERRLGKLSLKLNAISEKFRNIAVAGVAAMGFGIAKFASFETGLAQIATLGVKDMGKVKKSLQDLRGEFGITGDEATKGYYDIISAGAKTHEEAMERMTASIKLAKAGNTDLGKAVDIVTTSINVFGAQGESATNIIDKLFSTVKDGKTTVEELGSNIGSVASIANTAGVKFDELVGSYASLTSQGVDTIESTTAIKGFLTAIIKPTPKAVAEAKRLGIEFNSTALASKGLAKFLGEIKTATNGNVDSISKLFGSIRGLNFAAVALSDEGFGKLKVALKNSSESAGVADEAFNIVAKTVAEKIKVATQRAAVFVERLGGVFWQVAGPIMEKISLWLKGIGNDKGALNLTGNIVGLTTAVALLGFALSKMGVYFVAALGATFLKKIAVRIWELTASLGKLKWAIRGVASATGIGLLIVAIGLLIEFWGKIVAVLSRNSLGDIFQKMWLKSQIYLKKIELAWEHTKSVFTGDEGVNKVKKEIADLEKAYSSVGKPKDEKEKLEKNVNEGEEVINKQKEIDDKLIELKRKKDEAINALDAENNEKEIERITEKQTIINEQDAENKALMLEKEAEFKEMLKEMGIVYDEEAHEALMLKYETDDERDQARREQKLAEQIEQHRNLEIINSKQATASEKIEAARNTKQFKAQATFQSALLGVAERGSKLWKAAKVMQAITDLRISIPANAEEAYGKAVAAYPPPFGEALGRVTQALIYANGFKTIADIRNMNEGGIIMGSPGIDNNFMGNFMGSQGELIVPSANFEEVIDAVVSQRQEPAAQEIIINLDGEQIAYAILNKNEQNNIL